jgi:hypothetical protein
MSIVMENVAAEIAAPAHSSVPQVEKKRSRSGKKVYKPQLATKVKWALEDCMERTLTAQRRMRLLFERFEEMRVMGHSSEMSAQMGKLEHELFGLALDVAELERIVTVAVRDSKPAGK